MKNVTKSIDREGSAALCAQRTQSTETCVSVSCILRSKKVIIHGNKWQHNQQFYSIGFVDLMFRGIQCSIIFTERKKQCIFQRAIIVEWELFDPRKCLGTRILIFRNMKSTSKKNQLDLKCENNQIKWLRMADGILEKSKVEHKIKENHQILKALEIGRETNIRNCTTTTGIVEERNFIESYEIHWNELKMADNKMYYGKLKNSEYFPPNWLYWAKNVVQRKEGRYKRPLYIPTHFLD